MTHWAQYLAAAIIVEALEQRLQFSPTAAERFDEIARSYGRRPSVRR